MIHTIVAIQVKLLIIFNPSKSKCFQGPVSYFLFCGLLQNYLKYLLMQNSKFTLQKNRLQNLYFHNKHKLKLAAIVAPCGITVPVKLFYYECLKCSYVNCHFQLDNQKYPHFLLVSCHICSSRSMGFNIQSYGTDR